MSDTTPKRRNTNFGLNLLRVLLCFGVVLCHFWRVYPAENNGFWVFFKMIRSAAVPTFVVMAFFFAAGRLAANDPAWFRKRLVRLWKPFLFWSCVSWCVAKTLFAACGTHAVTFGDLGLQLLLGANNNVAGQFWFHSNIIMLTIGFFALYRYVRADWRPIVLGALVLVCLVFQYTELNLLCFGNLRTGVRQPFGRLCGTIVFAVIGIGLAHLKPLLDGAARRTKVFIQIAALFTLWLFIYHNPCPKPSFDFVTAAGEKLPTFGAIGFQLTALATAFVLLFYFLPIGRLPRLAKASDLLARYCMGIYCTHMFLGWILNEHVFARIGVTPKTFTSCLLLWSASWLLCFGLSHIPLRFTREIVE